MLSHPAQGPGNLHNETDCVFAHQARAPGAGKEERQGRGQWEGRGGGTPGDPESIRARKSLKTRETVRGHTPRPDSWGLQTQIQENSKNKDLELPVSPARFPCSLFSRAGEC